MILTLVTAWCDPYNSLLMGSSLTLDSTDFVLTCNEEIKMIRQVWELNRVTHKRKVGNWGTLMLNEHRIFFYLGYWWNLGNN